MTITHAHLTVLRRFSGVLISLVLCLGLLGPIQSRIHAQDSSGRRQLAVGAVVTATLDSETFVQTYSLLATEGDTISVEVTTEVAELAVVVIITDERGEPVAQDIDTATPTTATISELAIPANGTYYILVMRGSGAEGTASGEFTLKLGGKQQIAGQTVTLESGGLTFDLAWSAAVNLNLEVRDPVGGTVHAFSPGAPSGGTLDSDVNANCDAAIASNPSETIAWPTGDVPSGSYEIIVYYIDPCSIGGPQVFTLSTSANAEEAQTISGTLNPGQQYLARLVLAPNGEWALNNGGVNAGLNVSLFGNQIANAEQIALGSVVSGAITNSAPAQAYSFEATSGTSVRIDMTAQTGSLDTYLVLLGPDLTPLVDNDDNETGANSTIERNLTFDGTYTIIATRYGLTIGGTEGEYALNVRSLDEAAAASTTAGTVTGTEEAEVALPAGAIEVKLTWLTGADLQLQVRDPRGDTVFDDQTTIRSGGTLVEDGNRNCTDTTTSPVSYIYWPQNRLETGIYEVEVWYQDSCSDNTPVNFALSVNVQGQTVINTPPQPIDPGERYLITFRVENDTAGAGSGGFFDMAEASSLSYNAALDTATPITYGGRVSGSITQRQPFQLYSFAGQQGDIVTIGMSATGGTLDPALYLISPEGIQVNYNDDVVAGDNPDSVIDEATLVSTGTYYIVATHYGLKFGGTEGTYNLTLVQE